jgi:hypothetical protein
MAASLAFTETTESPNLTHEAINTTSANVVGTPKQTTTFVERGFAQGPVLAQTHIKYRNHA